MAEKVAGSRYSSIAYQRHRSSFGCAGGAGLYFRYHDQGKKDKATFGSAYKVENGVNKYNLEDGSKSVSTALITLRVLRRGKERHPLSPWVTGQERCPLILPAAKQEIRRGRGFSHLTGAG